MASLVKGLIDAGIHYGHRTSGWNPKMQPYIYGKKNGIHIIDVRQTIKGLLLAKKFVARTVADGKEVLFVGTKRQARPAIEAACDDAGMPYVTERWLGGMLTNFRTIRSRLKRLEELETLMDSEEWENYSKKMASQLVRERRKISRNLGGIRTLHNLPGALVVVDVRREMNALREARTLGIPTVCLLDTDGDPEMVDIPIPGNDDAMRAIDLVVKELAAGAKEGKTARAQVDRAKERTEGEGEGEGRGPRRSSRAQFRADEPARPAVPAEQSADTPTDTPAGQTDTTAGPADEAQAHAAGTDDNNRAADASQTNPPDTEVQTPSEQVENAQATK